MDDLNVYAMLQMNKIAELVNDLQDKINEFDIVSFLSFISTLSDTYAESHPGYSTSGAFLMMSEISKYVHEKRKKD